MLIGRWAQTAAVERNRHRLLSGHMRPRKVRIDSPRGTVDCAVEELITGDVFAVQSGQIVPVEARLESPGATLGTAWINGEAEARACRKGACVSAGAVNLGLTEISVRALQPWSASLLARLLRPVHRDVYRHTFLERVIRGYLIAIFGVAIAAGLSVWTTTHNIAHTWAIVTAVLVVSCPCAIGLAFPLTNEIATAALRRQGVFIRENDLWPRLARVRKIIFDKTGTLTRESPALKNPGALHGLSPEARSALITLVQSNPHPVSQSLYEHLLSEDQSVPLVAPAGELSEEIGQGVTLQARGVRWTLRRPRGDGVEVGHATIAGSSAENDAEFTRNGVVLARFHFTDAMRTGARQEIAALQCRGFEIFILSGDRECKVSLAATALGIAPGNAVGGKSPLEKSEWIKRIDRHDTLMFGDGANDSLAFDAALVRGTPVVHRGVLENKSDFYYLGHGLGGLHKLFDMAITRRRTQQWLLIFSIAYNLLAVGLAACGYMNPLFAAVLMPTSSIANLTIVGLGMRERNGENQSSRPLPQLRRDLLSGKSVAPTHPGSQ